MPGTILVPLDGSRFSEHSLPYALAVARRTGARICLGHVQVPIHVTLPEELPADFAVRQAGEARERMKEYLEKLARKLEGPGVEGVEYDVVTGAVVDGVNELVKQYDAQMIVMTTHGRGGFARAWLGSATDAVLRDAGVPILITRPGEGAVDLERAVQLSRVLVALDGSKLAEQVLEPATELAGSDGRLVLLSVTRALHPYPVPVPHGALLEPVEAAEDAREYLSTVAARLNEQGIATDIQVVSHESPAVAILESAADLGSDLIAIATRGRGGIARLLLGSTADKVIRGASVPVLAWRPKER